MTQALRQVLDDGPPVLATLREAPTLHDVSGMRLVAALAALSMTGCMAFTLSQQRNQPARREAKKLAGLAVAEIVLGGLIGVASYYWFENTEPTMDGESKSTNPRLFALLGILTGAASLTSGVIDAGIAGTQAVTGDYVMSATPN